MSSLPASVFVFWSDLNTFVSLPLLLLQYPFLAFVMLFILFLLLLAVYCSFGRHSRVQHEVMFLGFGGMWEVDDQVANKSSLHAGLCQHFYLFTALGIKLKHSS